MFEKITFRGARYFGIFCPRSCRRIRQGNAHDDADTMIHCWEAETALTDKEAGITRVCLTQTEEIPIRFRNIRDFPAELFGEWWRGKRIADEERYMDAVLGKIFEKSAAEDPVPIPRVSVSIGINAEHLRYDVDVGELIRQGILLEQDGQRILPLASPGALRDAKVEPSVVESETLPLTRHPPNKLLPSVWTPLSRREQELVDSYDVLPGELPGRD